MKSFFEEYGFVILAAIVVILLIAMCTPIGNLVKSQITGIVDSFANKTNTKLNAVDAGENTAYLRYGTDNKIVLDISSANSTDQFSWTILYTSGGQAQESDAQGGTQVAANGLSLEFKVSKVAKAVDVGSTVQVKAVNKGTKEVFYSNSITAKVSQ